MPHTTRETYKTKAIGGGKTDDIVRALTDAVRMMRRELTERIAAEAVLREEMSRLAIYSHGLVRQMDITDGFFEIERPKDEEGSDLLRETDLDETLKEMDVLIIAKRVHRVIGQATTQLKAVKSKWDRHESLLRTAEDELPLVVGCLNSSVLSRREAYVLGPCVTDDEWDRLESTDERSPCGRHDENRACLEWGQDEFQDVAVTTEFS